MSNKMRDNFCIRPEYRSRDKALTFEYEAGDYWNEHRIKIASVYQYYVYLKCRNLIKNKSYSSFLDVGCGPAIKAKNLILSHCQDIALVDQPSLKNIVNSVLPSCEFISLDLEDADYEFRRKFDLVACSDVLEHLLNPDNCMNFIKRNLAPNGITVLSTPERDYLRGKDCLHSSKPEHIREWNQKEFIHYVTSRGFQIIGKILLPQVKLSQAEFYFSRVMSPLAKTKRWSSCQVLVCRLST